MGDEIPDPTELRKKLGILPKSVPRATIHEFSNQHVQQERGAMNQLSAVTNGVVTLADFEAVPREVDEAESQKIDEILAKCSPACGKWLKKYIVLGNRSAASRAINYSAGTTRYWRTQYPEFKKLLEFYEEEIRERWNELAERRAAEGFKEQVFTNEGAIKYTKMRQDPHFMKELMKKMDPDWKDEAENTNITITVSRTEE